MRRITTALAAVSALLLTGCGATDTSAGSTPSPSASATTGPTRTTEAPVVERDATYGTVEELRDAVVLAGYECPEYAERESSTIAAESAACEDHTVLLIYSSQTGRDENLAFLKGFSGPSNAFLVGPNWIVNSGRESIVDEIRPELGGVVEHGQADL